MPHDSRASAARQGMTRAPSAAGAGARRPWRALIDVIRRPSSSTSRMAKPRRAWRRDPPDDKVMNPTLPVTYTPTVRTAAQSAIDGGCRAPLTFPSTIGAIRLRHAEAWLLALTRRRAARGAPTSARPRPARRAVMLITTSHDPQPPIASGHARFQPMGGPRGATAVRGVARPCRMIPAWNCVVS